MKGRDDGDGRSERPSGGLAVPGERWLDNAAHPGRAGLRQALDEEALSAAFGRPTAGRDRVWAAVQMPWAQPERHGVAGFWFAGAGVLVAGAALLVATGTLDGVLDVGEVTDIVAAPSGEAASGKTPPPGLATTEAAGEAPGALATTAGQRTKRTLARGVTIEMWPESRLEPGDEAEPPVVEQGRVRFQVPRQAPGRVYAVRVGEHEVAVLGTVFVVERRAIGGAMASTVVLEEGAVEIRVAGGDTLGRLLPGQSWSSHTGIAAGAEPIPLPRSERRAIETAAPAPVSPEQLLAQAQSARGAGQLHKARRLYEKLARGEGPLVDTALGELGRIYADLHLPDQALATYRLHRQRFPEGLTRAETDLSIIDQLARGGDAREALREARAFLARYPSNERRAEVALIAGDLERDRGDCRAALPLYGQAARGPLSAEAKDDAAFFQAVCLGRIDPAKASPALRGYLERFPGGRHAHEATRVLSGAGR